MNMTKIIYLIILALLLTTAPNAVSQTNFIIEPIPRQEAIDYLKLRYASMPLLSKAWNQYLTSHTGISPSDYEAIITALYRDLNLSFETYESCLQQVTERRRQASDVWLKDLQNHVSQADIIQHKEVIKKCIGALYLIAMVRSCHEEEKTVITKESYLTHALAELLKDQLAFIKTQDNAIQQRLHEYTEKINKLLQSLAHPVLRTTIASNGFNTHKYERILEACQKQNPTIVDLLCLMPSLQQPFNISKAIEDIDNLSLFTP